LSSGGFSCTVATLAKTYRADFSLDYGLQEHEGDSDPTSPIHNSPSQVLVDTSIGGPTTPTNNSQHQQAEIHSAFSQFGLAASQNPFLQPESPIQAVPQQHGGMQHSSQLLQVTGGVESPHSRYQPMLRRQPGGMTSHHPSAYGPTSHASHLDYAPRQVQQQHSRKRSRPSNELHLDLHSMAGLQDVDPHGDMVELTPHGHHAQPQGLYSHGPTSGQLPPPQHHHHRLPNQPPPHKMRRLGYDSPPPQHHGPPSVVGQEGMPPPAPRPRGPKLKFTPEDDQLLVDLKEKKNLTWKQIADFFPGRSSGTLQVRYCTKLKAKTTVWTEDMVCIFSPL
jgi:hypothetical protein